MDTTTMARELQKRSAAAQRKKALTRRAKVAQLKAEGMTGPEIAKQLGVKLRTIYHDFSRLKKELADKG